MEEENMRGRMVTAVVAVCVLALAGAAWASQNQQLDRDGLKREASRNKALSRYIKHNGYPDAAEVKPIMDESPWDDHEVTLYYLKNRKEISFARARVLGRPEVHITRYQRVMTDADIRAVRTNGTRLDAAPGEAAPAPADKVSAADPKPCTGSAKARAACAATRAESAADRVDQAAVRAENAASRTEAVVDKMVASRSSRRHHN